MAHPPVFLENMKSLEIIKKKQGFWQSSLPIWVLWTIEFIWVMGNPLNCHDKMISSQKHIFLEPFLTPKRSPGQNVDPRSQMFFWLLWKKFGTGCRLAPMKVRLEELVWLLNVWQRDLWICPFGGRKPFSTQPNRQIQDWGFSRILALQEYKVLVFQEHKVLVFQEHKALVFQEHKVLVFQEHRVLVFQELGGRQGSCIPGTWRTARVLYSKN